MLVLDNNLKSNSALQYCMCTHYIGWLWSVRELSQVICMLHHKTLHQRFAHEKFDVCLTLLLSQAYQHEKWQKVKNTAFSSGNVTLNWE